MAYDQQQYRPYSQNSVLGLASSYSYLDGVPFKISRTFRPSPQPELPPELLAASQRCEALHEEYDYDTEEAVLAWARAREEAKAKAIAEREATSERARAAVAAAESSSSDSEEDVPKVPQYPGVVDAAVKRVQPQPKAVKPPWQLPVSAASVSTTILTPMPIGSTRAKVQSPITPKAQLDLALFEQEGDPFDNLELQTINDMEELRTVLGGANIGGANRSSANEGGAIEVGANVGRPNLGGANLGGASQDSHNPDSQWTRDSSEVESSHRDVNGNAEQDSLSPSFVVLATEVSDSLYENVVPRSSSMITSSSEQSGSMNNSGPGNSSSPISSVKDPDLPPASCNSGFVIEPTGDGDYVQIRPNYSQQSVSFQRDTGPIYSNVGPGAESSFDSELPEQYANVKISKPVLPPIQPHGYSLVGEQALEGAAGTAVNTAFNPAGQSPLPQTNGNFGFAAGGMSQSAYVMSASASGALDVPESESDFPDGGQNHTYSNIPGLNPKPSAMAPSPAFSNNLYSRYGNSGSGSPSPVNYFGPKREALRSAKSNPDLSVTGHSPQPVTVQSVQQPWNPYKPLPPTPVSELRSSSSSTESLPTDPQQSPSPHVPSPSSATSTTSSVAAAPALHPEVDPYHSLSSDAKTFVNNLTAMGFSRSRASRAVEKFGADEREVLDHLFNVDKLVEKKFTPTQAETGLLLFRNDINKAEQFLDLYQQFMELGFTGDRIQTALVKHQLDRDKALDYLTA